MAAYDSFAVFCNDIDQLAFKDVTTGQSSVYNNFFDSDVGGMSVELINGQQVLCYDNDPLPQIYTGILRDVDSDHVSLEDLATYNLSGVSGTTTGLDVQDGMLMWRSEDGIAQFYNFSIVLPVTVLMLDASTVYSIEQKPGIYTPIGKPAQP